MAIKQVKNLEQNFGKNIYFEKKNSFNEEDDKNNRVDVIDETLTTTIF